ncbi:hypothetical protein SB783_38835, partial [Paraburkholderia sp. SIMBA_009]
MLVVAVWYWGAAVVPYGALVASGMVGHSDSLRKGFAAQRDLRQDGQAARYPLQIRQHFRTTWPSASNSLPLRCPRPRYYLHSSTIEDLASQARHDSRPQS